MLNIIDDKLQGLGITKNYKGYNQLKLILMLALEDGTRLLSVTKSIYVPLSQMQGCSYPSIRKNIDTIARKVWQEHYNNLCAMANYKLQKEPAVCELIAILVADIQRT